MAGGASPMKPVPQWPMVVQPQLGGLPHGDPGKDHDALAHTDHPAAGIVGNGLGCAHEEYERQQADQGGSAGMPEDVGDALRVCFGHPTEMGAQQTGHLLLRERFARDRGLDADQQPGRAAGRPRPVQQHPGDLRMRIVTQQGESFIVSDWLDRSRTLQVGAEELLGVFMSAVGCNGIGARFRHRPRRGHHPVPPVRRCCRPVSGAARGCCG